MADRLPEAFLTCPLSHRGLHGPGIPENSLAAFRAAIDAGYGIELDIQLSADGEAMVFHDHDLDRLTNSRGAVRQFSAATLSQIRLAGSGETIPRLAQVLELVAGRVPLLVEIKDQDGALGPNLGALEARAAEVIRRHSAKVAVMSFNPHSIMAFSRAAPEVPRGLVTCQFEAEEWPAVPVDRLADLAAMKDLSASGACFISHARSDLDSPMVAKARQAGLKALCWTIRSASEEALARKHADNVTFENYRP